MAADPPTPNELKTVADLEKYKAELASWLEQIKLSHDGRRASRAFRTELVKLSNASVIEFGRGVFRGALILNGGGSLATTTMLAASLQQGRTAVVEQLVTSLMLFAAGAMMPVVANGFSYFSQWYFSEAMNRRSTKAVLGKAWRALAIIAVCASGVCFVAGITWTALKLPAAMNRGLAIGLPR